MSIYIKNVDMPKGRPVCIVIDAAGQARRYDLDNDRYADDELFEAISISLHGRLIDVDAFIKKCKEMADKEDGNQLDVLVLVKWFLEQNAPTIIQASDEGE